MSRFLFVTWDGAGNLVPTLGLARRLALRGHDVRVLGHRSIEERCGSRGWRFRPLRHARDCDSCGPSSAHDMSMIANELWFDDAICRDVQNELLRERADVLVSDCLLMSGLNAGQASGVPTVALFHGALTLFCRGPFFDLLTTKLAALNSMRAELRLPAVARISNVYDACALSLVATPREFEAPGMPTPANVRFTGPFLDAPPLLTRADPIAADQTGRPLVVVGFSTSDQGHTGVLQRVIDALAQLPADVVVTTGPAIDPFSLHAGGNVRIVRFAPHARLFPSAAIVVTHAGLGTVMMALAHGVPLLCVPLGRDQFFNASRVEAIGAGRVVHSDAGGQTIADAARALIDDAAARAAASRMAATIAGYRNGEAAMLELEDLATLRQQARWLSSPVPCP